MSAEEKYSTPAAFRRGLTDRLRAIANRGPWPLAQLQRQAAYDGLLKRLYAADNEWIVKGATALLARSLGVRATIDLDLYRRGTLETSEEALRAAAATDAGDWFRFEIGPGQAVADGAVAVRVPVTALIGATRWAQFHVDIVGPGVRITAEPDDVPPLIADPTSDSGQRPYRAYPLVDHVADKIAAILATYGDQRRPSTRYKDLVDLVAIVRTTRLDARAQARALASEAQRRGIELPARFGVPDEGLWTRGYAAEAARSLLLDAGSLDEALAIARPFVDRLLVGTAQGVWDPVIGRWHG